VRGDPPDLRTDGEGNLDLFVDRRLVTAGAQAAVIVLMAQGSVTAGSAVCLRTENWASISLMTSAYA